MAVGKKIKFSTYHEQPAVHLAKLIEVMQKYNAVYPDCYIVIHRHELHLYRAVNNGNDAKYVSQIFFN